MVVIGSHRGGWTLPSAVQGPLYPPELGLTEDRWLLRKPVRGRGWGLVQREERKSFIMATTPRGRPQPVHAHGPSTSSTEGSGDPTGFSCLPGATAVCQVLC